MTFQQSTTARVVNITVLVLLPSVSAILFVFSIDIWVLAIWYFLTIFNINTFVVRCMVISLIRIGVVVKSVNNNITVTERVKARTAVLCLKYKYC